MARKSEQLHIAMFPLSAFGHMIPYYHLGIALAKKGVQISYISTPRNIERLPKIPSEIRPLFKFISLPLTSQQNNLPQGCEATVDLEFNQIPYLKIAYDNLQEPVKKFLSSQTPNWILSDASHWIPDVARECNVKFMFFSVFNATSLCFIGPPQYLSKESQGKVRPTPESLTIPPPWGEEIFPPSVAFRGYEAQGFLTGFFGDNESGISEAERFGKILEGCDAVGVRSCREFEGEYIDLYQRLLNKPVVSSGFLLTQEVTEEEIMTDKWSETFKWLDQQNPRSVIYVGFGSEYKLTKTEVYEIAYGLELAQLPFIWALRKPTWAIDDPDALPSGFLNRTLGKGIVFLGWAPQTKILAHPSIGGSLFHSGWGSIIETLEHGHNLILLPFISDQGINGRALIAKGLGIEVDRREDGSYTRDDIAYALKQVMTGDEANTIRARATQAKAIFGDRNLQNVEYVSRFVDFLRNGVSDVNEQH